MTQALITIDTELSASRQAAGMPLADNIACSLDGRTAAGAFGIGWQMDVMERHNVKGVFFVDPMPALVHGRAAVAAMVEPILRRGHEVQIHLHSEWLEWAKDSPVEGRRGRNIGDFSLADQIALIGWARDALAEAGVPTPTAFRAGNFGANDDTLRAIAVLGLAWDSSFNAAWAGGVCGVTLDRAATGPVWHEGVWELPVAGIWDRPGHFRPAQVCALSAWEMRAGLAYAAAQRGHSFCIVTHSFEMLSRDRARPNRLVMARFEALCRAIGQRKGVESATFSTLTPPLGGESMTRLPPDRLRTAARLAGQLWATWAYERRVRPI